MTLKNDKAGLLNLIFFTVCAITTLDTLTVVAAIGPVSLFWCLVLLVGFVWPYSVITIKLGTRWPDDHGIYGWVSRAFGQSWGQRVALLYWLANSPLWMASLFIMTAGIFVKLYFPAGSHWWIALGSLALIWVSVLVCSCRLVVCLRLSFLGELVKAGVVVILFILSIRYALYNGAANNFNASTLLPSSENISTGLKFLPAMVFNLIGFELATSLTRECRLLHHKLRTVVFWSVIMVNIFYLMGTLSLLLVIPFKEIGLLSGMVEVFRLILPFGPYASLFVTVMYLLLLFTLFSDGISWNTGACRVIRLSAETGGIPTIFARTSRNNAPAGANLLTGILASAVVLVYAVFAQSGEELFWEVFSLGLVLILLPYILAFLAYMKLMLPCQSKKQALNVICPAISALFFVLWAIGLILAPSGSIAELWQWDSLLLLAGLALAFGCIELCLN